MSMSTYLRLAGIASWSHRGRMRAAMSGAVCAVALTGALGAMPAFAEAANAGIAASRPPAAATRGGDGAALDSETVYTLSPTGPAAPADASHGAAQASGSAELDWVLSNGYREGSNESGARWGLSAAEFERATQLAVWRVASAGGVAEDAMLSGLTAQAGPRVSSCASELVASAEAYAHGRGSGVLQGSSVTVGQDDSAPSAVGWRRTKGQAAVAVVSASPEVTRGNPNYDLGGASFDVFTDEACTERVATVTTDPSGVSDAASLHGGTYYARLSTAPKGYEQDQGTYRLDVREGTSGGVTVALEPSVRRDVAPASASDAASGADTAQGDASLADAEFTFRFYAGTYASLEELPDTPTRTWTVRADDSGVARIVGDEANVRSRLVAGDELFTDGAGKVVMPLGTLTVSEARAPKGYVLPVDGGTRIVDGSDGSAKVRTATKVGGARFRVRDASVAAGASGTTSLEGIRLDVTNESASAVTVDGRQVAPGEVATSVTTGTDGIAEVAADKLPYGTYLVTLAADNGWHTGGGDWSQAFSVTDDGSVSDLTGDDAVLSLAPVSGGLAVQVGDGELGSAEAQGDATLEGAEVEVRNLSPKAVTVAGTPVQPGAVAATAKADDRGLAQLAPGTLPAGRYEASLKGMPEGYADAGGWRREFEVTEEGQVTELSGVPGAGASDARGAGLTPVRGGVSVDAEDATLRSGSPTGDSDFEGVEVEVVNASTAKVRVKGADVGPGEVATTFTLDKAGHGSTKPDELPFGTYEVRVAAGNGSYSDTASWTGRAQVREGGVLVDAVDAAGRGLSLSPVSGGIHVLPDAPGVTGDMLSGAEISVTNRSARNVSVAGSVFAPGEVVTTLRAGSDGAFGSEGIGLPAGTYELAVTRDGAGAVLDRAWRETVEVRAGATAEAKGPRAQAGSGGTGSSSGVATPSLTSSVMAADGTRAVSDGTTVVLDRVHYANVTPGESYTVKSTLHVADGSSVSSRVPVSEATRTFVPVASEGDVTVEHTVDATALGGTSLVGFDELSLAGRTVATVTGTDASAGVAVTKVSGRITGEGASAWARPAAGSVVEGKVSYEGLEPGVTYKLTAKLHALDESGHDLGVWKDAQGREASVTQDVTPEASAGECDVRLTFDGTGLSGKQGAVTLAFERDGVTVARTDNTLDPTRSVRFTKVTSSVSDGFGGHEAFAGGFSGIIDKVSYEGLRQGGSYVLRSALVDAATGAAVLDASGRPVVVDTPFVADGESGTVRADLAFDSTGLGGRRFAVNETILEGQVVVASVSDASGAAGSLYLPGMTGSLRAQGGSPVTLAGPTTTLDVGISYENLEGETSYDVSGVLHVIGEDGTDEGILMQDGSVRPVERAEAAGGTTEVSSEADLGLPAGTVRIDVDTDGYYLPVDGSDLKPGGYSVSATTDSSVSVSTYAGGELSGTGRALSGGTLTASKTWGVNDASAADVRLDEGSFVLLTGKGTVTLTPTSGQARGPRDIIPDDGRFHLRVFDLQTGLPTPLKNVKSDGETTGEAQTEEVEGGTEATGETVTNVSTAGLQTLSGAFGEVPDGAVRVSGSFVTGHAEGGAATGSATVPVTFDSSALAGKTVVAEVAIGRDDKMVARHSDTDDEGMTVRFADLASTMTEGTGRSHEASADRRAQLTDTVTYRNLRAQTEYEVTATLHVLDAEGHDLGTLLEDGTVSAGATQAAGGMLEGVLDALGVGAEGETDGDAGAQPVSVTRRFTTGKAQGGARGVSGEVTVEVGLEPTQLAGRTLVAVSTVRSADGTELVSGDLANQDAWVSFPRIVEGPVADDGTETGEVTYENLMPERTYELESLVSAGDEGGSEVMGASLQSVDRGAIEAATRAVKGQGSQSTSTEAGARVVNATFTTPASTTGHGRVSGTRQVDYKDAITSAETAVKDGGSGGQEENAGLAAAEQAVRQGEATGANRQDGSNAGANAATAPDAGTTQTAPVGTSGSPTRTPAASTPVTTRMYQTGVGIASMLAILGGIAAIVAGVFWTLRDKVTKRGA